MRRTGSHLQGVNAASLNGQVTRAAYAGEVAIKVSQHYPPAVIKDHAVRQAQNKEERQARRDLVKSRSSTCRQCCYIMECWSMRVMGPERRPAPRRTEQPGVLEGLALKNHPAVIFDLYNEPHDTGRLAKGGDRDPELSHCQNRLKFDRGMRELLDTIAEGQVTWSSRAG